jgi:hypothetical protein
MIFLLLQATLILFTTTLTLFMDINKPRKTSELRALLAAKQKLFDEAIRNNVDFNRIKILQENINELRLHLARKKKKK